MYLLFTGDWYERVYGGCQLLIQAAAHMYDVWQPMPVGAGGACKLGQTMTEQVQRTSCSNLDRGASVEPRTCC